MTISTRFRTLSAGLGATLVAVLLPLAGPAAPAHAAACTSEVAQTTPPFPLPTGPGCDDVTPPETAIETVAPQPKDDWIDENQVTFTFSGTYTDADADPISYECQLFDTPTAPATWTACSSPATYDDLAETQTTPYTFRVRAVDSGDDAIDLTTAVPFPQAADQPDLDQSPAETTIRVDTLAPSTFLFEGPHDSEGTGWPIARKTSVSFLIDANEEDVTYRCRLDGAPLPCSEGRVAVGGLSGGDKVFSVKATDPAGNEDATAATKQFVVPYDLTEGRNWKKVRARGYFDRTYLQSRQRGARLRFKARNIREFRLIAPAGPTLGKLRVRVGTGFWKTVNLEATRADRSTYYMIRDQASPLFSGRILIESVSRSKPVRVDALVFPPG